MISVERFLILRTWRGRSKVKPPTETSWWEAVWSRSRRPVAAVSFTVVVVDELALQIEEAQLLPHSSLQLCAV